MHFDRREILIGSFMAATSLDHASAKAAQPVKMLLGTATAGGGFPLYGAAIVDALKQVDPGLIIETLMTKGSTENVPKLERGEIDLGLVTGEVLDEALRGHGRPPSNVKIVAAMYSQPGLLVVRADSAASSISDLVQKPVAFGAAGSGLVVLARYVLDGLDLIIERDFQPIFLERAGDGPTLVIDRQAAALWGAGRGWPGFEAVSRSPSGARFIGPNEAEADKIVAKHAFLKKMILPQNTYPGQKAAVQSVGSWSFIVSRPGLSDDVVYRFTKSLHEAEPVLGAKLVQARETTAVNTLAAVSSPELLHPGTGRYLKEIGLLRP